jgi:hypothetical protein
MNGPVPREAQAEPVLPAVQATAKYGSEGSLSFRPEDLPARDGHLT